MTSDRAFALLERENPVHERELAGPDDVWAGLLRERIVLEEPLRRRPGQRMSAASRRLRYVPVAAALAAIVVAALVLAGVPGGGRAVEDARAAVARAAAATAASAEESGTAAVRITHDGEPWAEKTIRWNRGDLAVAREAPAEARRAGAELLLVDGMMYGIDPEDGAWVELGSPASIDPGTGTTPDDILTAVRDDVSGATLQRLTDAMTGLTTRRLADGSTVYGGSVAAGLVARESGFKEGESLRLLPFGFVAHDEADDPSAVIQAAVTVGPDGVVRGVTATWGAWTYEVVYSDLGATPALKAPAGARPLLRDR